MVELRRDVPRGLRPLEDSWIFKKGIPALEKLTEGKVHSGLDGRFSVVDPPMELILPETSESRTILIFGRGIDDKGTGYYVAYEVCDVAYEVHSNDFMMQVKRVGFLLESDVKDGVDNYRWNVKIMGGLRENIGIRYV